MRVKSSVLLVAAWALALALPACKKTGNNGGGVYNSVNDVKVPSGFNWESTRAVPFSIGITDERFAAANHTIAIYSGDPFNGGLILSRGSANTNTPYTATLNIAKTITEVYIVKTSPDLSHIVKKVPLGTGVTMSFAAIDPEYVHKDAHKATATTDDCSSGCTNTITTSVTNLNVNTGDVICITGSNINVGFQNVNGGTIRVCGSNVTLQNLNFNGAASLLITAGGSATLSGLNFNNSGASITNYGTLSGVFADNGYFSNYGTYTCPGDFNINSNANPFVNWGTMTVTGSFNNSSHYAVTNEATLTINGNFQQNSGAAQFVNNCNMTVGGNYNQSAVVYNYNLLKVAGTATINSGTVLNEYNGAMFKTTNLINNASIMGFGATSLVKVTGSTTFNSGASASGALQMCAPVAIAPAYLTGGAANGCTVYIPTTGCNNEGNGGPAVADADGDGVADATDEYPSDPNKAYNNYYPTSATGGTLAFEDKWPAKGDYDMNDLVIGYRYQVITNASNAVVRVIGNYTLRATGGELTNGFGVQFPVAAANVSNVTGATLEAGQSKAVVILFSNMRNEMTYWNTVPGATTSAERNYTVSFDVTGNPSLSTFGLSVYNPFIYNYGRGRETHLWGHAPTDLADATYLGTQDDNSNASTGRYYITATGLPWAIDIPAAPFQYPIEQKDITQAYLHFGEWGASGGSSFVDWYSNTASGFRNTANLY